MSIKKHRRILCIIPTLGHGGAQKVLVNLAHQLSQYNTENEKHSVSILTFRSNEDNFYTVNDSINLDSLNIVNGNAVSFFTIFKAPLKLRRFIRDSNPDVILSFQDIANFPVLMATIGLNKHVVVSERQDTRFYSHAFSRKMIRLALYPMANKIVVQTTLVKKQLPSFLKNKIEIIPNPVDPNETETTLNSGRTNQQYTAITVGRLEDQKDFTLLIKAATYLRSNRHQWKIDIYGAGSLRDKLQSEIASNDLSDFIRLKGATRNILTKLSEADLFLFPSKYEGFPNALGEAVSCGLPSIAFKNVSGNSDLIHHQKNGILLDDNERNAKAFAYHTRHLMDNPALRDKFKKYCSNVLPPFSREVILEKWAKTLELPS